MLILQSCICPPLKTVFHPNMFHLCTKTFFCFLLGAKGLASADMIVFESETKNKT